MLKEPTREGVIDTGDGTRLFFDAEERHLWIALEASAETLEEALGACESFIVAGSEAQVDALILALVKARGLFAR